MFKLKKKKSEILNKNTGKSTNSQWLKLKLFDIKINYTLTTFLRY